MNFQLENLENGLCRRNSKILTFSTVKIGIMQTIEKIQQEEDYL